MFGFDDIEVWWNASCFSPTKSREKALRIILRSACGMLASIINNRATCVCNQSLLSNQVSAKSGQLALAD